MVVVIVIFAPLNSHMLIPLSLPRHHRRVAAAEVQGALGQPLLGRDVVSCGLCDPGLRADPRRKLVRGELVAVKSLDFLHSSVALTRIIYIICFMLYASQFTFYLELCGYAAVVGVRHSTLCGAGLRLPDRHQCG